MASLADVEMTEADVDGVGVEADGTPPRCWEHAASDNARHPHKATQTILVTLRGALLDDEGGTILCSR